MKKVEIDGVKYTFRNRDEVMYGAEKHLERAQFAASLAMLSNKDVEDLARNAKKGDGKIDEDEFMNRVMSGEIKSSILDSHDAAISEEEEAIILSVGISRDTLLGMPARVVKQLAENAMEELGPVEDFSEASSTNTN
jgi:predicted methyltransferase MtxX (methanogen marker protein 4)